MKAASLDSSTQYACRYREGAATSALWNLLHPLEQRDLGSIKHPDRLRAAVFARLLLKAGIHRGRAGGGAERRLQPIPSKKVVELAGRGKTPTTRYRSLPDDRCPVFADDWPREFVSIAHDDAYCHVAWSARPIGCDVEFIDARTDGFRRWCFNDYERAWLAEGQSNAATLAYRTTLAWTAKEAYYKFTSSRDATTQRPFQPSALSLEWLGRAPLFMEDGRLDALCRCGPSAENCRVSATRIGAHLFTCLTSED